VAGAACSPPVDDWDRHWDAYAVAAARNPAQRYRRRLALALLERRGAPRRLLDLGCGQGDLLLAASARWSEAELLGVEPSAVGVAQARVKAPSARFFQSDLEDTEAIPQELRGWATHAVCSEVLEHVDDPVALLSAARMLMAPACRLVVTVPGGRMSAFDRHIGHRRHYTPEKLAAELRAAGLGVRLATGAGFPFFNLYRALVIMRGERLAHDVAAEGASGPSAAARAAMLAFRPLMALNLPRSRWGRQIVSVAQAPPRPAPDLRQRARLTP